LIVKTMLETGWNGA